MIEIRTKLSKIYFPETVKNWSDKQCFAVWKRHLENKESKGVK